MSCKPTPSNVVEESYDDGGSRYYSIAGLKNLYQDDSHRISDVVYVVASITANDLYGEYDERIVVEDDSGAIEISVDLEDDLYLFGIGTQITLYCTDLWLGGYGGTIILGAEQSSDSVVDPIALEDFDRRLLSVDYDCAIRAPQELTIADITTKYISCFIKLSGLEFVADGDNNSFCRYDTELGRRLSTTHTLRDESGSEIDLYVPSSAIYANEEIPSGRVTIYSILSSYGGNYSVTLVEGRIYLEE